MKKNRKWICFLIIFAAKLKWLCGKKNNGNYLIDISKYVLTGIVISSFFRDFGDSLLLVYGLGIIVSVSLLTLGLVLTSKKKEDK